MPLLPFKRLLAIYFSRQFFIFMLFGGLAAIVNLAVGSAIYGSSLAKFVPYWMAVGIGALSGLLINFTLNFFLNFYFRGRSATSQLMTFCIVALVGTGLTSLLSQMGLTLLRGAGIATVTLPGDTHVSAEFVAQFFAVGLVACYSFAAHRYFSFNVGFRARLRHAIEFIRS